MIADAEAHARRTVPEVRNRLWTAVIGLLLLTVIQMLLTTAVLVSSTRANNAAAKAQSAASDARDAAGAAQATAVLSKTRADGGRAAVCIALALNGARQAAAVDLPPACADPAVNPLLPPSVCAMFHTRPDTCGRDWPRELRG